MKVMSNISEIYRPVTDPLFMEHFREFAARFFPYSVRLAEPEHDNKLRVSLVRPEAVLQILGRVNVQKVVATLPDAFKEPVEVETKGATYVSSTARESSLLVVKCNADDVLQRDTAAVLRSLSTYGVRTGGRHFYNAIVGSVDLSRLEGDEKIRLRHGLSDLTPQLLQLGPGAFEEK